MSSTSSSEKKDLPVTRICVTMKEEQEKIKYNLLKVNLSYSAMHFSRIMWRRNPGTEFIRSKVDREADICFPDIFSHKISRSGLAYRSNS
jgi:hypothetical protein